MFTYIYEWVENLAFYLVLTTAVIQVIPNTNYKKYIRFFTGLILILLLMTPILKIFGMEGQFDEVYNEQYEREARRIKEATNYLEGVNIDDYIPEGYMEKNETSE